MYKIELKDFILPIEVISYLYCNYTFTRFFYLYNKYLLTLMHAI